MHSVPVILSPLSQQEYIYCSVKGEARLPSVTGTAQMQEGDQYNSTGVTALRIRLSLRSPGPFSTHHMLPWHPNASLTTTQPFPTQILFSQPAPNTPLFSFPQWATQTWAPVAVNHALRKRAESSKKTQLFLLEDPVELCVGATRRGTFRRNWRLYLSQSQKVTKKLFAAWQTHRSGLPA